MKKLPFLLLTILTIGACERKREPNKLLDQFPSGSSEVVIPAEAAQQFLLLKRDLLRILVPVISRISIDDATFGELTPLGGGQYSFTVAEPRYGSATFTIEMKDDTNATIDPIGTVPRSSSTTLKSVSVTGTGASALFPAITESLTVVLQSSGVVTSPLRMFGSTGFTGSSYSITFTFDPAGCRAIFQGLSDGLVTAAGAGGTPPAATALNLTIATDRTVNGSIAWEGREGGLHLETNGSGFVVTSEGRILLD